MTNGLVKNAKNRSNQKHMDPGSLRLHYGESLKQHRSTLRKKEQHVRYKLNVIEESIECNCFWENWKILNKQHRVIYTKLRCFWFYNKEQTKKRI
jgi:hypothetical protein